MCYTWNEIGLQAPRSYFVLACACVQAIIIHIMTEKTSAVSLPVLSTVVGTLSSEAAKRLVVLSGLKSSVSRDEVEKLAGNSKRIRRLHFPVVQSNDNPNPCAAILYCGKRDAAKAVSRLNSLKFSRFGFVVSFIRLEVIIFGIIVTCQCHIFHLPSY